MSTLINICGAGRSGTTMLDLMLGHAPDAFSCGEVYAWFRPWRAGHYELDCLCGENPCPYWEKIKNVPENLFHKQVCEKLNVNFVIDSSKDLLWVTDNNKWAELNGIKVVNILLWKNPVSLAYSHWKRVKGLKRWLRLSFRWRKGFIKYYNQFFDSGLSFRAVNYNELVQNPKDKLSEICKIVGMEYFEGKEKFWNKQHHHLFGSSSVRRQAESRSSKIQNTENFPTKFLDQVERLSEEIKKDVKVQNILEILKKHDVSLKRKIVYV